MTEHEPAPKQPSDDDLGLSIIDSLNSDVSSITQDFADVALDSLLKDGLLRDIPIVSTMVNVTKTAITVRDKLLLRKIIDFVKNISVTDEEKREFVSRLHEDRKFSRRVGEQLILFLD